jgi:hypothetical protein
VAQLTINEIRGRARAFSAEWRDESREAAERQTFWNEWFAIFGIRRRRLVAFEHHVKKLSGKPGSIDVFWPGRILAEHKSRDEDLDKAMGQAEGYLAGLEEAELPRLVVLSDFARFRVRDLDEGKTYPEFGVDELADHIELFSFLAGYRPRVFGDQDEVNVKAAELMGRIHDALDASGYGGHPLRVLLVRLLFLLFADDTGVWETGLFEGFLEQRTATDGRDLGPELAALFEVLDTPLEHRQSTLDEGLAAFPFINGQLFAERLPMVVFDAATRAHLMKAARFNWSAISPAIFGSMFQSVMKPDERRAIGAHYTTEQNILKVIEPLFLDELREESRRAGNDRGKLLAFREKIAALRFFDPGCGCGNFLVIAYRELRALELDVLKRLRELDRSIHEGQLTTEASALSQVDVDQFYGIEIEEFPCRIAEVAMYLMDHLANQDLSREFGLYYARFPLHPGAHIHNENALAVEWGDVLPARDCDYLLGNPPFVGMAWLDEQQKQDNRDVFARLAEETGTDISKMRTGRLDYVACWYAKAWLYMRHTTMRAAFVSTNSITQGEQARSLGPLCDELGYGVDFAHRSFRWTSEARGKAIVTVVVIGFSSGGRRATKLIYDYPEGSQTPNERKAKAINWYLTDGPRVYPPKRTKPLIAGLPESTKGSQPTDGGHLIVDAHELPDIEADPIAARYVCRYLQANELLKGGERWCLWLVDADPADLRQSPILKERLAAVRRERLKSKTESVREAADTPAVFTQNRQPTVRYLALPEVSSERRRYIPAVYCEPSVIAGNKLILFPGADLWLFGMLQSAMFMAWVKALAGRMKTDISISPDLTYCTFPFPSLGSRRESIEAGAQGVLDVRAKFPDATLADLYDPLTMPADLTAAHRKLDRAVDALYGRGRFDELNRFPRLLEEYQALTGADR